MQIIKRCVFPDPMPAPDRPGEILEVVREILVAIRSVPEEGIICKVSKEATSRGQLFHDPGVMNARIKECLLAVDWDSNIGYARVEVDDPDETTGKHYIDFGKGGVYAEVQLGKYSFVSSDLMRLHNATRDGRCRMGVLVVPHVSMREMMNSGPPSFKRAVQYAAEMRYEHPLMIVGISTQVALDRWSLARQQKRRRGRPRGLRAMRLDQPARRPPGSGCKPPGNVPA